MSSRFTIYDLRFAILPWAGAGRFNRKSSILNPKWFRAALPAAVLLIQLLLPGRASALDSKKGLLQYNCRTWSRQNGLPLINVNALAQTQDGYLWFGTADGWVRFDGMGFKLPELSQMSGLPGSKVACLASAHRGGLWVGLNYGGFGFYNGRSFSLQATQAVGNAQFDVRALKEDEDGTLWLGTGFGPFRLTPAGILESLMATNPFSGTNALPNVVSVCVDREHRVWFGTVNKGLYYWQGDKIVRMADPELESTTIESIAEDPQGQIWIGTVNGLFCLDANLRRKAIPPLTDAVFSLLVDREGTLWIGTGVRGVGRYRNGAYEFLNKTDGLAGNFVNALMEDREGSLWIGTRDGVSQLVDVKFPIQQAAEDPSVDDALAISPARGGGVWIGSAGGVTHFDGAAKTYSTETGISNPYVKRVLEASDGSLYLVCGLKTLAVLSPEKKAIAIYTTTNMVVGMAEDAHGVVVSVGGDLYRAGTNYFRPYVYRGGEVPPMWWIVNLASGRGGAIWASTVNGVFRIKDGEVQHWSVTEGLASPRVNWVWEGEDGIVWGGTQGGIVRIKNDQVRMINRTDGLFDDNIYAIIPDNFGNLWVDSGRGIFSVSRQGMNDFADGTSGQVSCRAYDGLDSVKAASKTVQEPSGCKTADGRIWFPSPDGVVIIDPGHVPTNSIPPPVHIDRVLTNGYLAASTGLLTVPPGRGELEFYFNALSFIEPQRIHYRYQLEGYDPSWVEAGDRRQAFYTNLKPGNYRFHVIAANADGVWNDTGDSMDIHLLPHFYETAWFGLLCLGLGCGALGGIYAWRVRHLTRQQLELRQTRDRLETEVTHRTAELARANEALKIENVERKQVEESLRLSREEFKDLFDNAPAGFHEVDAEGRLVRINNTELKMLGYTEAELLGKEVWKISAEEEVSRQAALAKLRGAEPPPQGFERRLRRKDGSTFPVMIVDRLLKRDDGTVTGIRSGIQDITEAKQAEESLQRERNLLRTLIDHIPDFIYVRDLANRFQVTNEAFARLMGVAGPAALIGKRDADFYPPDRAALYEKIDQEVFGGAGFFNRERVIPFPNGQELVVLNSKVPFRNAQGEVVGLIGIGRDITERKRMEAELDYERNLLRTMLDSSPDHIYFKDAQSRFVKASRALVEQFGVASPEAVLGKTDADFFDAAHAGPALADEREILRTGRPVIGKEEREVWKDGRVTWVSSTKLPLRDARGEIVGIMGISRDITERKRLEEHLIQSQKMETVGKLAGGIAHEFNSILTAIIGQSELLRQDLPAGSPLAKNAVEISQAADRAATLTRQLLAYGRRQFLRPEALNLNRVITGMSSVLGHLMGGEGVEISVVPAAGLKTVTADAGQIEQVIINLAMNARDAMPCGGRFTLETANVTLGPDYVGRFPELKAGEYVMLAVSDTGRGMSEQVKARAFEPFFTTKDVGQGTGLGLPTCYGIVKQSGGHINVYSELGRGTTFKIYLPQVETPSVTGGSPAAPDLPRGTETILLVEDDPALRELAATLLRRLGYTVWEAANGVEALSLKQQQNIGHVDLLFTDVVMPHMSGKELSERVRVLFPHTRILFTSAYTENAIVNQGVLDKGVMLLQKPFTPSALAFKVREVLDQPFASSPSFTAIIPDEIAPTRG